jgi:cytochrome c556
MQHIDVNFVTVTTDVEQNQTENAQRQHQEFRARFQAMREACSACHDTEREYFVDARVQALIDEMGSALTAPTVDPNRVKKLMMDIGETSCFRCHLVHMPSVYAKHRWNQ